MDHNLEELPKKPISWLKEKLDKMAKDKSTSKDVSDVIKDLQKTLESTGKKTDEEKLQEFKRTFIKKSTIIPDDFKTLFAEYTDTTEIQPTDNAQQSTSGAAGNAAENKGGKSHQTANSHSVEAKGQGGGSGKKEVPKPQPSDTTPSVHKPKNTSTEQDIANLKDDLAKEKKNYEEQKRTADQRLGELEELRKELIAKEKELKLKEGEVLDFQQRYDKMTEHYKKEHALSEERQSRIINMESQLNQYSSDELKHKKEIEFWKTEHDNRSKELHVYKEEMDKLFKEKHTLEKKEKSMNREIDALNKSIADEKRKSEDSIKKLIQERDDLRDRFSKVAGAKLSDDNSDIADLSDPNRAMKLSERFGQLYDDEWTNAFEALTDQIGMHNKEAIRMLLDFLKECLNYCEKIKKSQLDILNNVFLHPIQCPKTAASEGMQGMREMPRIASKEEKTLKELRKQITVQPGVIEEVKQAFIVEVKSWEKKGIVKKHVDVCVQYLQKCAELCWLIALHDPPLFVKFDVKPGEKLDPNVYTAYSASGNNIDFLVWPPLYNGENGGLLSKGTAEPIRSVKKGK